jgi:protein-disulfide isomerase
MSKRQEIRLRHQRQRMRNRIVVIALVAVGALLIGYAFISPLVTKNKSATNESQNPVIAITPVPISAAADGVHLGDPNAPVKMDIYSDFRCSACKYYSENFESQIISDYVSTGKVYYTYHTFIVIDGHDGTSASYNAANAAMCAADQGRFWDYKTTLFANQITEDAFRFSDERLSKMAENLNLDVNAFNTCYVAKRFAPEVNADITQAQNLALNHTPTIFVNGASVDNFSDLTARIDAALAGN